jgi:hypothetical protein
MFLFTVSFLLFPHQVLADEMEGFRDTRFTRTDFIDVEGPVANCALLFVARDIGMGFIQPDSEGSSSQQIGQSAKLQALMKKMPYGGPRRIYLKPGEYHMKTKVDLWTKEKQSLNRYISRDFYDLSQKFEAGASYVLETDISLGAKQASPRIRTLDNRELSIIHDHWQTLRQDIKDTEIKASRYTGSLERLSYTDNRLSCPRLIPGQNTLSYVNSYALTTLQLESLQVDRVVVPDSARLKWYSDYDWSPDGRYVICILNLSEDKTSPRYAIVKYGGEAEPETLLDRADWDLKWTSPELNTDGRYLYFNYQEAKKDFVARRNMEDGAVETLFPGTSPTPAPDNKTLCYVRDRRLYLKDLASGSTETSLTGPEYKCSSPDFSPDGKWIVFSNYEDKTGYNLYCVAASGGRPRELTRGKARCKEPHWGHDGKIYFITGWSHGSVDCEEIWRLTPVLNP